MTATKDSSDVEAIKKLISSFFDSINAADTKALLSHFWPCANLTIIRQDPPLPPPTDSLAAATPQPSSSDALSATLGADKEKLTVVMRVPIESFVKLIEDGQKRRKGKPGPELHEKPDLVRSHALLYWRCSHANAQAYLAGFNECELGPPLCCCVESLPSDF